MLRPSKKIFEDKLNDQCIWFNCKFLLKSAKTFVNARLILILAKCWLNRSISVISPKEAKKKKIIKKNKKKMCKERTYVYMINFVFVLHVFPSPLYRQIMLIN